MSPRFDDSQDHFRMQNVDPQACLEAFVSCSTEILPEDSTFEGVMSYVAHNFMRLFLGICSLERRKIIAPNYA